MNRDDNNKDDNNYIEINLPEEGFIYGDDGPEVAPVDFDKQEEINQTEIEEVEEAKKKQVSKENTPERKGIKDKLKEGEEKSRASAKTAKSIEKKKEAVL